jgi:hypothetical protein
MLLSALISVLVIGTLLVPFGASQATRAPSVLRRIISIEEYGIISYNDTYMISSYDLEKAANMSLFTITIPGVYAQGLVMLPAPFTFKVVGSPESPAGLFNVSEAPEATLITVRRDSLLGLLKEGYVNFTVAYRLIVSPEQIASQLKNITFPLRFTTDLPVHFFMANISIPADKWWETPGYFDKQNISGRVVFYMPYPVEQEQKFSLLSLTIGSYITSFYVSRMSKTVSFDPLLGLSIEEGFSVYSNPRNPQSVIPPVYITSQATDVEARDLIGLLTPSIVSVPNSTVKAVSITPRVSLANGGNYTFFVKYKIPAANFTSRDGDKLTIKVSASCNYTSLVREYILTINLPTGARVESANMAGAEIQDLESVSSRVVQATIKNLPYDVLETSLVLTINYPILWVGYTPSALIFVAGAIVLGAYYTVLRKPAEPEKPEVEGAAKLAADASRAMRKSIALYSQVQELETRYFEGDINRKEFRGLHQKLRSDLDRALSEVRDATRRLTAASPHYAGRIRSYESLWAELQAKHASQREVGFGYLNKKISRAAYAELSERYSREISSTISKIRSLLEEFPSG